MLQLCRTGPLRLGAVLTVIPALICPGPSFLTLPNLCVWLLGWLPTRAGPSVHFRQGFGFNPCVLLVAPSPAMPPTEAILSHASGPLHQPPPPLRCARELSSTPVPKSVTAPSFHGCCHPHAASGPLAIPPVFCVRLLGWLSVRVGVNPFHGGCAACPQACISSEARACRLTRTAGGAHGAQGDVGKERLPHYSRWGCRTLLSHRC